jgi:hypothetical protein
MEVAHGEKGQQWNTNYTTKTPGDLRATAASLLKREGMQYKASDPASGRKEIFVLLANLGIRPDSYENSVACTKEQMEQFELDLQTTANAVRDGEIRVKSRGCKTTLLAGVNPCSGRPGLSTAVARKSGGKFPAAYSWSKRGRQHAADAAYCTFQPAAARYQLDGLARPTASARMAPGSRAESGSRLDRAGYQQDAMLRALLGCRGVPLRLRYGKLYAAR